MLISLGGFTDVPALSIWICNCTVSPTTMSELVSTAVIFGESPRANCAIAPASKTENKTRRNIDISINNQPSNFSSPVVIDTMHRLAFIQLDPRFLVLHSLQ